MLTGLHCEWVAIRARNLDCLLRNKRLMNAARRKSTSDLLFGTAQSYMSAITRQVLYSTTGNELDSDTSATTAHTCFKLYLEKPVRKLCS